MASVQSAPGFSAQGGIIPLPPNLTKEHVQATYLKYQQMRQQGVREDDPEFIKARNLLQAVQKQTSLQKQKQMWLQQQAQQQQAQQQAQQQQQQDPEDDSKRSH